MIQFWPVVFAYLTILKGVNLALNKLLKLVFADCPLVFEFLTMKFYARVVVFLEVFPG